MHPQPVKPATFLGSDTTGFRYVEKSNPRSSGLQFLTYGIYKIAAGATSGSLAHPEEEALLFAWTGTSVKVDCAGTTYTLEPNDVLYVPRGSSYQFQAGADDDAKIILCRAPATKTHPPYFARWKDVSKNEKRIRHLKGKDVYLMFDVSEPADKLVAGFTLFQPHQRSWPPHNHTDQEEIYIFTKGRGSMEVYADEETKTFVRSVSAGDAVTIPILNYHPVFSQEDELHFIWCIAGNRYWVGDKNKDFMTAKVDKLTT